jgi:Galactose oxidase, central domain/Kelch motif
MFTRHRLNSRASVYLTASLLVLGLFAGATILWAAKAPRDSLIVPVGSISVPRFSHTATLLANGKVLLAGGLGPGAAIEGTAEIYDPDSGRFTRIRSLASARGYGAVATLLRDGKVLIAGGSCGRGCILASVELFDPARQEFSLVAAMSTPRAASAIVRLHNGDVLIMGGDKNPDELPLATAELYHPATGKFSLTGRMTTPRDYFAAIVLKDGRTLLMGGSSTGQNASGMTEESSAELYDPATGQFARTGSMSVARNKLGAALLPDGRVLVVGGQNGGAFGPKLATTEIYDPATGKFTAGPMMNAQRYKLPMGVVSLPDGRVLVAGGADQPEIYDPKSNSFTAVSGAKLDAFYYSTATTLENGDVLLAGGYGHMPGKGASDHAWVFHYRDN